MAKRKRNAKLSTSYDDKFQAMRDNRAEGGGDGAAQDRQAFLVEELPDEQIAELAEPPEIPGAISAPFHRAGRHVNDAHGRRVATCFDLDDLATAEQLADMVSNSLNLAAAL